MSTDDIDGSAGGPVSRTGFADADVGDRPDGIETPVAAGVASAELLGFDPDRTGDVLAKGAAAAGALADLVDERTVDVNPDLDEDAFFAPGDEPAITTRYDLEKAVPMAKKRHFEEVERYWVNEPYSFVIVFRSRTENETKYYVVEPHLDPIEADLAEFLTGKLRTAITGSLSDTLRKLSSANDTGMTLLESIRVVADTSSGKLARELEVVHAKVAYGTSLKDALIEFNNRYHVPRLARTVKLISKAQEASSQITAVLTTAAQASENQDDIDRERKSRTRMQVVIILMTYLTLLAVMAVLKAQFLDVMGGLDTGGDAAAGAGGPSFGGIDTGLLSLLLFHAVTIQAILAGLISGYMRDAEILSGTKYVVVLMTIALCVWAVVG